MKATFDLRPLQVKKSTEESFEITDGDIPCTPEEEPSYSYTWNFCDDVTAASLPSYCQDMGKSGVVLQHVQYPDNGGSYCYILGHYDPKVHELTYNLLDANDPSKGVSIAYPAGETCADDKAWPRSATIDVECANVDAVVDMAQEPSTCNYHLAMKSYYGCPTECGITKHGLCNSHGHCAYDPVKKEPYCYCNTGYSGSSCQNKVSSDGSSGGDDSYDGFTMQVMLLALLLIIVVVLIGGIMYLGWQVTEMRKQQTDKYYSQLSGGENEMVETVSFR